jgi:hypothetical protein
MRSKKYSVSERSILTTVLYSDIFSFPLTKDELWRFLISRTAIKRLDFDKSLKTMQKDIVSQDGFYALKNREAIIRKRIKNLHEVEKKKLLALRAAGKLSIIPSILFIGLSGGLAAGNVTKKDDIDFVIITKKNTLFISRLLIIFLLQFFGVRRSRNQKKTADTICVNLLFDETALDGFANKKDIYTAREIAQMIPLFERGDIYKKFMTSNSWIQSYLPNFFPSRHKLSSLRKQRTNFLRVSRFRGKDGDKIFFNPLTEFFFRFLQTNYMKGHITSEIVTGQVLAFHPNDYRVEILRKLRLKMLEFGLLTKA